ncbi:methyl-accepting chemotaxis protein [Shumkonia mesophila]|uniref:methyl-accepting chemotaxis protein n=1 Tax=Shumkonia mesophila TaxID=2838854 RepID=UPI002934C69C|nr:methyl-accepting chemotaxis protein [Shumkonia mesophila]
MIHAVASFFRDLSVGTRLSLLIGFGLMAIAAAAGVFAVADVRTQAALERRDVLARILDLSHETETAQARLRARASVFLMRGDRSSAETYAQQSARLLAVLAMLDDMPETAVIRRHIQTVRDGIAEHANEFRKIADLEGDGPPIRLDKLTTATEEALAAVGATLSAPGREALAVKLLAVNLHARRVLAGDAQAGLDMVQARHDGFDRELAQARLGDWTTVEIAERMNVYVSAILDEAAERGRQKRAAARLDEILDYLQPGLEAIAAFRDEADAAIVEAVGKRQQARLLMYAGAAGAGAAFLILGLLMALGISRPLRSLALAGRRLADGDRAAFIPISTAEDEVGDLARALRAVRDAATETDTHLRARDLREKALLLQSQASRKLLLDEIETRVRDAAAAIADAAAEIRRLAAAAGQAATDTGRHAGDIAAASGETTASLRRLATVASTLHASVAETHRRLSVLEPAAGAEAGLPADAAAVGQRVAYIGRLALRTRLMALNSVIGTARAGERDAEPEVEMIAAEIGALARQVAEESAAFEALGTAMEAVRAPFGMAAQSGRDENALTRDILRNAEGAVAAILTLSNAISRITRTAGETGRVAEAMRATAEAAAERSDRLRNDIDGLLARLRQ